MKIYQIFEKETEKKHEVTRTFDCEEDATEVQIDVWNDDYVFWLQKQVEKLFAIPVVSQQSELLFAFQEYYNKINEDGELIWDIEIKNFLANNCG